MFFVVLNKEENPFNPSILLKDNENASIAFIGLFPKNDNDEKHALRTSHVRGRRQIEMQAFPLDLCLPRK